MMSTPDRQRRTVLRGTLAAGIALLLAGCDSRQKDTAPPTGQAPSGSAPATGQGPSGGTPGGKVSQAQAKYQNKPNQDQKCGNCMQFIADSNTCKVVEGTVSPEGWCTLYAENKAAKG